MKKTLLSKTLILGIVLLFIGVSYSSAISVDSKSTIDKKQRVNDFDSREISNTHPDNLYMLFNRLEVYSKRLILLSKNNPEITEKWEELGIRNSALKDINNDRSICDKLENIYLSLKDFMYYLQDLYNNTIKVNPIKAYFIGVFSVSIAEMWLMSYVIGYEFKCWDEPFQSL